MFKRSILAAGFAMLPLAAAVAQTAAPAMPDPAAAYVSARNQLGVLTYCQEQGHIGAEPVEIQTKLLAMLPPGDTAAGDEAEAKGKAGTVSGMGVETTLADGAAAQKTTEADLCKQMGDMITQLGAQLPK
ncbi:pore-forming ESAT-6 family protein [Paracoccus pacificus]|uniref:Pore-forming ESAT-6 family protein n=1 Tax=Paracoccus pacificus TaxID=1463598 RepID=A0ABW4R8V0_9RHOB